MRCIITKYALTTGVFTVDGTRCESDDMLKAGRAGYFHKGEWFTSTDAAIDRVHEMRKAAVRSAQKKLSKLESLNIEAMVKAATGRNA